MQALGEALNEVKDLYQRVVGQPPPELSPGSVLSFPPGVDPVQHAVREVGQLAELSEQLATAPRPAGNDVGADVCSPLHMVKKVCRADSKPARKE